MLRKILIVSLFIFATFGFSASEYEKDITVLNQSRNDKVVAVFKKMMKAYEEEDLSGFFSYISEDRFIQDYMTFYDAIEKDMRVYDILNVDFWVDKITEDGIKRYLYVTWEKRYQSVDSDIELYKKGYSRFLFDEVNGKYKLIGLAGNNFWGGSLAEWKEEVPEIAGQVPEDTSSSGLPDLTITNIASSSFTVANIGNADASGPIGWEASCMGNVFDSGVLSSDLAVGASIDIKYYSTSCPTAIVITVDSDDTIQESDETNNVTSAGSGSGYSVTGP